MASCVYIPRNKKGEELKGFVNYRKALGYETARDVFIKALSPSFQKDYKRYLKFDEQQVPTYESIIKVPYIKNFIGIQKLMNAAQKAYIWVSNTKQDYERLVEEAHKFNISTSNEDLTAYVEKKGDKIRVKIVEKNEQNDRIASDQYGVMRLNNRLADIFSDLGVTVEMLEDYESENVNGMVDFSKASGMAEGFAGLIRIANNAEGVQALPEEFAHLLIGIFRDNPIVARSLNILINNRDLVKEVLGDEYQSVYDSYEDNENQDALVAEEALGKILQSHLKQASERKEADNSSSLNRLISRLVNFIKSVFRKYNVNDVLSAKQIIDDDMQSLSKDFLNGKKKITKQDIANAKRNAVFNQLKKDVDNVLQLVQNAIDTERKRLKITSNSDSRVKDDINKRIATLNGYVNDTGKLEGVISYAQWALSDLEEANASLDIVLNMEGNAKFATLRNILTTLQSYSEFIKDFRKTLDQYEDAQIVNINGQEVDLGDLWRRVDEQFQSATTRFEDAVLPAFISFVAPFYNASPLKDKDGNVLPIERIFKTATKEDVDRGLVLPEDIDITFFDKWCISMGNSSSIIASLYDKAVKTSKDKVRLQTMRNTREIWALREKAEKRGITTFEWMFEKNKDGKKTGYYISKYNQGQFEEDYQALLDRLKEKYGENPFGIDYQNFNAERKAWLEQHSQRMFGTPIPNDSYLNPEYANLTEGQKATLNEFLDYKVKLETGLPSNQVSKIKAIQRRRSDTQRWADSLSNPKQAYENAKEELANIFQRREDDDQIFGNVASGLTDFTGREYMTLPLFYTSKLKNPEELSTDVFSDLMVYAYSTNTYKELDQIIDPLEIGKEAVKQKRLLKTKGGKPIEETVTVNGVKTKRPIYIDEVNNGLIQKIQDFMESQLYSRYFKDEGSFNIPFVDKEVDIQKATSVAMKFASITYLGCNYLAGIANVATALGMQNIEAFGGRQHFSSKDLLAADKEYARMLPEFLAELGARNKQSELALFDEMCNIRQDYKAKVGKTQKKSYLQRIFGSNWLFVQQGAGDHWIYNRTGIAMAKHYKVKYQGKVIPLWEAREIVTVAGKKMMKIKDGVKNLDGTDFNIGNFSRAIEHVNHTFVGIYDDDNQNAANRVAVGRLLQQMRKWIIPQMMVRFQSKRKNLDTGLDEEGYQRTFWLTYMKNVASDLKQGKLRLMAEWSKLSPEERANCWRAIVEYAQFTAVLSLSFFSGKKKGDPERIWALKFIDYILNREVHELGFLAPTPYMITETLKTVQSPITAASALYNTAKISTVALNPNNWIDTVQSGDYEGYTKIGAAILKSPIPGVTQWKMATKMFDKIEDATKYYSNDYR